MHPGNPRMFSRRLGSYLALASLISGIGCGITPANPSLSSSSTNVNAVASGAFLGYAWDQIATGLRPIRGIAGAAQFGSPVYGGSTYNGASVCVDKKYALLTSSKGRVFLAPLPSGAAMQIADHLSAKEQIAISPSCSAALLYAPGTSSALIILGLPASPKVQALDLSQAGLVTAAIVSDSGLVLAASQTGGKSTVQVVSADGSASQVATVAGLGGMTFLSSTQNALIADAGKNVIWLASNLPGSTALNSVAAATDGVTRPSAVAASADGRWLIIANQGGNTILRLDLNHQSPPEQIACNCTATNLIPLSGNSTFLISDLGSGPVWTFDGDSPSPRIVFIPGVRQEGVAR